MICQNLISEDKIQEEKWNYEPTLLYSPPKMDFTKKVSIGKDSDYNMNDVCKKYKNFMFGSIDA